MVSNNSADILETVFGNLSRKNFPAWDILDIAGQNDFIYITPDYQLLGQGEFETLEASLNDDDDTSAILRRLKEINSQVDIPEILPGQFFISPSTLCFFPAKYDIALSSVVFIPKRLIYLQNNGSGWQLCLNCEPVNFDELQSNPIDNKIKNPDTFKLTSTMDHEIFKESVAEILNEISDGKVTKVVLARRVEIEANRPFCKITSLNRLKTLYPTCTIFSMDGFLGASPELLIKKSADTITLKPLAGTIASSGNLHADKVAIDELMASKKNRNEHSLVVEWLKVKLSSICNSLEVSDVPDIVTLRNVIHLATPISAKLDSSEDSILSLIAKIHPTPAVGGIPDSSYMLYQEKYEIFDRGRYAGPVGWLNSAGDGEFYLGIRSAQISNSEATIWAGVGIVENSDPELELIETQLKLQAMLSCLVRP